MVLLIVLLSMIAVLCMFVITPQRFFMSHQITAVRITSAGCVVLILLALIGILACWDKPVSISFFRVLFYAIFTRLPISEQPLVFKEAPKPNVVLEPGYNNYKPPEIKKTSTRYINIDYNAWEYAGCECLWAGIVTKLVEEIEKEFGVLTTRLFRTISLDTRCRKTQSPKRSLWSHLLSNPKTTMMVPNLIWFIMVLLILVTLPMIAAYVSAIFPKASTSSTSTTKLVTQVVSFLPISISALYAAFKVGWAMLHTHTRVITSALQGTKGKFAVQLGFMEKVKTEVLSVIQLVRTVEFIYQVDYKIIISVDDLDRIQLSQVKSVLEAVSILLSDRSSPFVCLLAIDPRVAFQCIEDDMGSALLEANVNGHDYLKKIINLPFCLPETGSVERQRYIIGLVKQADDTKTEPAAQEPVPQDELPPENAEEGPHNVVDSSIRVIRRFEEVSLAKFMFQCRHFFYNDPSIQSILTGNPRHLKRIFNVISLSSIIIDGIQKASEEIIMTEQLAKRLVVWVVIIDEWPVKMRLILETIFQLERKSTLNVGRNYSDNCTLYEIFNRFTNSEMLESSQTDAIFERFLEKEEWLTAKCAKSYLPFTINIYPS